MLCDAYAVTVPVEPNPVSTIQYDMQIENDSVVFEFNQLGVYSVYEYNSLLNKYFLVNDVKLSNLIEISDLSASTSYKYFLFRGEKPTGENLIGTEEFCTKPNVPKFRDITAKSNQVILSWDYVNMNYCYYIYRSDNNEDYKKIAEVTEFDREGYCYIDKDVQPKSTYYYKFKIITTKNDCKLASNFSKPYKVTMATNLAVPTKTDGKCKTYAYYTAVTCKSSNQYKLLNSSECYTDKKTGIRMVDDCYCIALGSYYGSTIGEKYLITLSTGKSFKAILCDQKSDRHTDKNNQYAVKNKDIIEFYIEKGYKPAVVDGDYSALAQFSGKVVSIEKLNS